MWHQGNDQEALCPLPRRKCLGALALSKRKHTGPNVSLEPVGKDSTRTENVGPLTTTYPLR